MGSKIIFCGDGINDLPALAAADVGISVGATDAVIAAAVSAPQGSVAGPVIIALQSTLRCNANSRAWSNALPISPCGVCDSSCDYLEAGGCDTSHMVQLNPCTSICHTCIAVTHVGFKFCSDFSLAAVWFCRIRSSAWSGCLVTCNCWRQQQAWQVIHAPSVSQ